MWGILHLRFCSRVTNQDLPFPCLHIISDWQAAAMAELQMVLLTQVTESLDFLLDLPNLRSLMMGKLAGAADRSMYYMLDLQKKLLRRWPDKDILHYSCPDSITGPR